MKSRIIIIFICVLSLMIQGCSNCSRSGRRHKSTTRSNKIEISDNKKQPVNTEASNVVKMKKVEGVYEVTIRVNGIWMYFIFDTGASSISISQKQANILYELGKLTSSDFKGKENYMDAQGNIYEGTVINLKEVKIGSKTLYNIEASVINNLDAPLLLGQSALEKFGKISIDYSKGEITFE
jgi:aspartyl protease family protein